MDRKDSGSMQDVHAVVGVICVLIAVCADSRDSAARQSSLPTLQTALCLPLKKILVLLVLSHKARTSTHLTEQIVAFFVHSHLTPHVDLVFFFLIIGHPPTSPLFPHPPLFH